MNRDQKRGRMTREEIMSSTAYGIASGLTAFQEQFIVKELNKLWRVWYVTATVVAWLLWKPLGIGIGVSLTAIALVQSWRRSKRNSATELV